MAAAESVCGGGVSGGWLTLRLVLPPSCIEVDPCGGPPGDWLCGGGRAGIGDGCEPHPVAASGIFASAWWL